MENLIVYQAENQKIRLGSKNDGGYVIVDLPDNYDFFISGGIGNDSNFEKDFVQKYNIKGIGFDGSKKLKITNINNFTFIKKNLGSINDDKTSNLVEYIKKYNNLFLKIDIEGHEFRLFPELIKNNLMKNIKQFVVEIHSPNDINLFPKYFKGLQDINNDFMFNLLKDFNKTHTLVHFHANNGCKMATYDNIQLPHVFELTFIRNENIKDKIKNKETFPTELDSKNIKNKKDYYFDHYPYCNK